MKKISNQRIESTQNGPILVLTLEGGQECFLPAQAIEAVHEDALKQFHAYLSQHGAKAGQWRFSSRILIPQTWNTGTTDNGKIAVTVDRDLPSEQTFALSPDHATELSQQLIETAGRIPTAPNRQ
jgi:hypothetical protein